MVPITLLALSALRPDVCPAPSAFHRLRGGARDHDPEDDASATMAEEIKKLKDSSGAGSLLESLESLKRLKALLESREPPQPQPPQYPPTDSSLPPILVEPAIGDLVRVRGDVPQPRFDWGEATPASVGRLVWFQEDRCVVDFPSHSGWNGLLSEMERVSADDTPQEGEESGTVSDEDGAGPENLKVGERVRMLFPPEENSTSAASASNMTLELVGVVTAMGGDDGIKTSTTGEDVVTVTFPRYEGGTPLRWIGAATDVERVDDPIEAGTTEGGSSKVGSAGGSSGGRAESDGGSRSTSPWGRKESKSGGGGGRGSGLPPLFPKFDFSGGAGGAGYRPGAGGRSKFGPLGSLGPLGSSPLPGVPAPTWFGWTLGAAFAQMKPGMLSSGSGSKQRKRGSKGMLSELAAAGKSEAAAAEGNEQNAADSEAAKGTNAALPTMASPSARLFAMLLITGGKLLAPTLSFLLLLGLLLSALSMLLDIPVASLLDSAWCTLPHVLHSLNLLPHAPTSLPAPLPPIMRSLVLVPLRLPSVILLSGALYLLCVPGFDILVRTKQGFEQGYRATTISGKTPSNAKDGGSGGSGASASKGSSSSSGSGVGVGMSGDASDERLATILDGWNKLIAMVNAARLAAFGIAALALLDRMRPPPSARPVLEEAAKSFWLI